MGVRHAVHDTAAPHHGKTIRIVGPMTDDRRLRLVLAGLLFAGFSMRMQVLAIGPLLPLLRADLDIPFAIGGLLVTVPVLCMGIVAVPAPRVAARFGATRVISASLATVALIGIARALMPDALAIVVLTIPIGVAIGLGGALLPVVAKERAGWIPMLATGTYVTGFVAGSAISSGLAVPIAEALGSWRAPLVVFGLIAGASGVGWWLGMRGGAPSTSSARPRPPLPWRRPVAWLLVAVFASQSMLFFGLSTWLPSTYVETGLDTATAGSLVGLLIAVGLPATIVLSLVGDRLGSRRSWLVGASALTLIAIVGIGVAPEPAALWAILAGIGLGLLFPLALALPLDVSNHPGETAGYVGLMLGVGYLLSGAAPVVLGALRDAFHDFGGGLVILGGLAVLSLVAGAAAGPSQLARERARGGGEAATLAPGATVEGRG
jgi:CP family cyanate transporter-like MFS transporter